MEEGKKSRLMYWSVWLLVCALLLFVLQQIDFVFNPIQSIFSALFMPLLIAGFLFYLVNPFVVLLEKIKVKRILGEFLMLFVVLGLFLLMLLIALPVLIEQAVHLVAGLPDFFNQLEEASLRLAEEPWMNQFDLTPLLLNLEASIENAASDLLSSTLTSIGNAFAAFTDAALLLITVPVILFYMLHDGRKFPDYVAKVLPEPYKKNGKTLLKKMNETIASYISGKGLASLLVGVMLFVLYSLVGLPSAFLLAVFAAVTNFIPYVGPFIGAGPAVFVGLVESWGLALLAGLFVLIAQQLDSNVFTPYFVGKSLAVHPLTVILVLLASANIAGLVGMLIGVPVYALLKTVVVFVYHLREGSDSDETK